MNPAWWFNRLRAMSGAEVVHRLVQSVKWRFERAGFGRANAGAPVGVAGAAWAAPIPTEFGAASYVAAADSVLEGRFSLFRLRDAELGFPPLWNRDPLTQVVAPLTFGKTIDYRRREVVGDIKYLWELNRHLELVVLAQAYHLSGERKYADGCRALLESWFEQCPYPLGANWSSSLEVAIRLVNWSFVWHLLEGDRSTIFLDDAGAEFKRRWFETIFRHMHFIAGHKSLHSSANNHLLGELLGLLVGSLTWPLWEETRHWSAQAHREFEHQALLQNTKDGVNREQALWYHHEVTDMMLIAGLVARANGKDFSADYWRRLEAMLEFVSSVMDVRGGVPSLGDADDAVMVRFNPDRSASVYQSLLATGAVLFGRADFKRKGRVFDDKSRWLLGDAAAATFDALQVGANDGGMSKAFADGGYYILGADYDTEDEIRIVADAGPLGYLSIAAHGHADALAFTLTVGGEAVLIDPGTYVYQGDARWREYFRGTSAHNTLRVDSLNQSVSGGTFLWMRHARAECERFVTSAETDRLVASHDGYLRLADPVLHRRELVLDKQQRTLSVRDEVRCRSAHLIEIFWHFSEHCHLSLHGGVATVATPSRQLRFDFPRDATVDLVHGSDAPPLGWVSHRFHEKLASHTIVVSKRTNGDWDAVTQIRVDREMS